MKKYLLVLFSILLLLPMTVHADVLFSSYSTNKHVVVGGYREIIISTNEPEGNHILKEINIDYDPDYFSIDKKDINIITCDRDITNHKDVVITFSSGKITIKATKDIPNDGFCHSSKDYVISLDFLALKTGETEIKLYGDYTISSAGQPIIMNKIEPIGLKSNNQECPKCAEKECPTVEEKECPAVEEKECPACEETKCPEIVEEKNFIKDNAILLMIASFVIGVLLGFVIFHKPVKKSGSKPVEISEANEDKKE